PTYRQAMAAWRGKTPGFTKFAASFTQLGGARFTLGVAAMAALLLLIRRKPGLAVILLVTDLAERELVEGLKELTARPRPLFGTLNPASMAFPSGDNANSLTALLANALLRTPATPVRHPKPCEYGVPECSHRQQHDRLPGHRAARRARILPPAGRHRCPDPQSDGRPLARLFG